MRRLWRRKFAWLGRMGGINMNILTVTVNPAIDKTYYVDELVPGQPVRVSQVLQMPGGKGINVLRVLRALGVSATATGFLAGNTGQWLAEQLTRAGFRHDFYWIDGETRGTTSVVERRRGRITEFLELGPFASERDAQGFLKHFRSLCTHTKYVTMSGSLLPGLPQDYYARMVDIAQTLGVKACVDTHGNALQEALLAKPYLVKINQDEFATWLGRSADETPSSTWVAEDIGKLNDLGCNVAVVTCGPAGSYLCSHGHVWHAMAPKITPVNTVGSGDAYLAGLVASLGNGATWTEALKVASAAGASNSLHFAAGQVDMAQIQWLKDAVIVTQIA
jgi:1-phosphofructokinase family hexose kinase